jgi:hypothetical protein
MAQNRHQPHISSYGPKHVYVCSLTDPTQSNTEDGRQDVSEMSQTLPTSTSCSDLSRINISERLWKLKSVRRTQTLYSMLCKERKRIWISYCICIPDHQECGWEGF